MKKPPLNHTIEDISTQVTHHIATEVERQIQAHLERAQGVNWTAAFKEKLKECQAYRDVLENIRALIQTKELDQRKKIAEMIAKVLK